VGRCRGGAERSDDLTGVRDELRESLVVGVEDPDASLADCDARRRRAELDRVENGSRVGIDRRGPGGPFVRLAPCRPRDGRDSDHDHEESEQGRNERDAASSRHALGWPLGRRGRCQRLVVLEDLTFELLQRLARLEAELLGERATPLLVDLQRLGLPARAVEREHELATEPLPERVLRDERPELDDRLGVTRKGERGFDSFLARCQSKLLKARDLLLREGRVREVGECRPAPEPECSVEDICGSRWLARGKRASAILEQPRELRCVELVLAEGEGVPVAMRCEPLVV